MTTQHLTMFNNAELPAWIVDDLTDLTGTQFDMSSGWTFTVTLARTSAPATALFIKSTGITASATAITVAWAATDWDGLEAAVRGTDYVVLLKCRRTSDSFDVWYRPGNPPTLKLKAAPGTSAVSPNVYPVSVTAASVSLVDAGGYYAADDVEDALAEQFKVAGLYLDGTSSNKLSTPDAAALDVTDLDLAARVAPDAWVSGQINVIAAKYNTSVSWQFYINTTGNLVLLWSANGSTVAATITSSVVIPGVTDGQPLWVRATLDADNGASGYTVKFYTATDREGIPPASAWTQFGTTTTGGATTTVFVGTSSMEFGSINGSSIGGFRGTLFRFVQRASIDGALVADCNLASLNETAWKITSMTMTDSATRVWTLTGSTFEWRRAPRPTGLPIFGLTGDSLTTGVGVTTGSSSWYSQLARALSTQHRIKLTAVSSRTLATALTEDATLLDGALVGTGQGYAFGWIGTNDLNAGTASATVIANYQTWCEARRAAGWLVVAFTILPRTDAGFNANFETGRQAFNTSIRANWSTYADALVDVAADTRIGDAGDELDTTYYNADKVHMTATGYGVIKDLVKAQLLSVFALD